MPIPSQDSCMLILFYIFFKIFRLVSLEGWFYNFSLNVGNSVIYLYIQEGGGVSPEPLAALHPPQQDGYLQNPEQVTPDSVQNINQNTPDPVKEKQITLEAGKNTENPPDSVQNILKSSSAEKESNFVAKCLYKQVRLC